MVIPGHPDAAAALRYMIVGVLIIGVLWWRPEGLVPEPRDHDTGKPAIPPGNPPMSPTLDGVAADG